MTVDTAIQEWGQVQVGGIYHAAKLLPVGLVSACGGRHLKNIVFELPPQSLVCNAQPCRRLAEKAGRLDRTVQGPPLNHPHVILSRIVNSNGTKTPWMMARACKSATELYTAEEAKAEVKRLLKHAENVHRRYEYVAAPILVPAGDS